MTRIVAGVAGGRRLATPPGEGTRPTSERVREALFARLEHLDAVDRARVLDLFAGSGALGLEALSRGAESVLLVEKDRKAAEVTRRNARDVGMPGAKVITDSAERVLRAGPQQPVHLVLVDPPYLYGDDDLTALLADLVEHDWLVEDAVLAVERSSRSPEPVWPADVHAIGPRKYGETTVWFAEYLPEGDAA